MATKLPDDVLREIKRLAHEYSRLAYERKRDEVMRRAMALLREGDDLRPMLDEEWREAIRGPVAAWRNTHVPARTRDMVGVSVLHAGRPELPHTHERTGARDMPNEPNLLVAR